MGVYEWNDYIFGPWNTAADGSGTSYTPGDNITMPPYSMTLYALWTAGSIDGTYTITYSNNYGEGYIPAQTAKSGSQVKISNGSGFTKDFWELTYWSPSNGGTYSPDQTITMPGQNIVLTAEWTVDSAYMVTIPAGYDEIDARPASPSGTVYGGSYDSVFKNANENNGVTFTINNYQIATTELTYGLWSKVKLWAQGDGTAANPGHGYKFHSQGKCGFSWDWKPNTNSGTVTVPTVSADNNQPVVDLDFASAMAWCNAFSEYQGLQPVYYDQHNAVARDASTAYTTGYIPSNTYWFWVKADTTKNGYRLPTEMEWEVAAHDCGNSWDVMWPGTNSTSDLSDYVVGSTKISTTSAVKTKKPNAYGLYDMGGNALEWCYDWYADPPSQSATNYSGPAQTNSGTSNPPKYKTKVLKGGIFGSPDIGGYAKEGPMQMDIMNYKWQANDCAISARFESYWFLGGNDSAWTGYAFGSNYPSMESAGIRLARNAQ